MIDTEKIRLRNVRCVHNIGVTTGYGATVKHVVVFLDSHYNTYAWITTTSSGLSYKEGLLYDIEADYNRESKLLYHVKDITPASAPPASEQNHPTAPDAYDIILGIDKYNYNKFDYACYTIDKKVNTLYNTHNIIHI